MRRRGYVYIRTQVPSQPGRAAYTGLEKYGLGEVGARTAYFRSGFFALGELGSRFQSKSCAFKKKTEQTLVRLKSTGSRPLNAVSRNPMQPLLLKPVVGEEQS